MNKNIVKALLVITSSLFVISCNQNVSESSLSVSEHEHTFTAEWYYDETYHYHPATCGHDVVSDKAEHVYGEWIIDEAATLFKGGKRHRECSVCGYVQKEDVEPLEDENALDLPLFYINTENKTPITSKEIYVNATMNITNSDRYNKEGLTLGIRGRGNYSWSGTEKKSYRIKFDEKYQPLGQGKGKAKSWTLLAVHCDKTLLRNDAAFYFASKLDNLVFTSSSSFVELYLNDKYQGVYELCDQMQVNKYRVNIDDTYTGDENGYLLELDKNASEDVIMTDSGETYEVKSDYANTNQLDFIIDYMNQVEDALEAGNKEQIGNLIDLPSCVDAYLVEELFKNLDVGWGSFYYSKQKGDKLYFGPVWDFDLTSGNAESDDYNSAFKSYKYTYVGNDYFSNYMQQHSYYLILRQYDWFNEMIKNRWFEIKQFALETIDHINYMADTYHASFERNFVRWPVFGKKINREPSEVLALRTYDKQVDYLKNWLDKRIDWLDKFYKDQVVDK